MIKRFRALLAFAMVSSCLVPVTACGGSAVVQCRIDAVRALPENENEISIGALTELEHKLLGCHAAVVAPDVVVPDAGPPK
jgi:hypothetical protein